MSESVLFTTIRPVSSSVSNDPLRDEASTRTKTPALTTAPVRSSCGCNMHEERQEKTQGKIRGGNRSWLCWWQLFINSFLVVFQPPASKLCTLFAAEVGVSDWSWKLKARSCSNEIKTTEATVPDFQQGILYYCDPLCKYEFRTTS